MASKLETLRILKSPRTSNDNPDGFPTNKSLNLKYIFTKLFPTNSINSLGISIGIEWKHSALLSMICPTCDERPLLSTMFSSTASMTDSQCSQCRTHPNKGSSAKRSCAGKVFKCRPPASAANSPPHLHQAKHLFALIALCIAVFLCATSPTVLANSNSQSFPTFSYCSYIFINEDNLARPNRSPPSPDGPSQQLRGSASTTPPVTHTTPNEHNTWSTQPETHHSQAHHSRHHPSRPYPLDHSHHHHLPSTSASTASSQSSSTTAGHSTASEHTSPYRSSHAPTQPASTVTRHSHKSRRSVDQDSAFTTGTTATSLSDSKLPVITDSTAQAQSAGPDFFKPDQDVPRTAYLDQQHYYQQTFQHQFQFSYSPPSNSHPVYIGLEIIDVDLINDAKNFFSLQLHLFELWHEPRLNTSALQMFWATNSDPIPVNEANIADCLWTPSLVFEDSSEMEQLLPPTTILLAYQNRVLLRKSRHSLKVRCHMNLQIYPMDKHICHFRLRTFTDPVHKVDLRWLNDPDSPKPDLLDAKNNRCVIQSEEFTPSLFDIKVGSAERVNHIWLNEHYSLLDQAFIFERRMIHSLLTVYIPSSLVVTLSWLQFWFDVEAVPGRMSLGIMSTLTIMTQILTNYEKAGNHVTAVDIWLFVCLIMVFLALMEYAVAYTISHYYDGEAPGSPTPWSQNFVHDHKPLSGQTNDSSYKQDGDPFFASVGPLRANLLRNSFRNRRNGANNPQQPSAATPVVDFESNNNLFRLKGIPPLVGSKSNADPETGAVSNELVVKDISRDQAAQSPSPQPNQIVEDEEKSKLLSGHPQEEEVRPMPLLNRDYTNSATRTEQLDLARNRLQLALEEYNALMKEGLDETDNARRVQTLPNTILLHGDDSLGGANNGSGRGLSCKKRKSKRNESDPNNNNNDNGNNGKPKASRFSSIRRPTLRRQASSRTVERSPSGMSEVDYLSRYIFPIAFVLFVVIYWIALFYYKLS